MKRNGMNYEAGKSPIPLPQSETSVLTHFDRARRELELAASIDEVKSIRDKAEALRQYAKQSRLSLDMLNHCAEIRIRAERRAGDMLKEMEKHPPGPIPTRDRCHLSWRYAGLWEFQSLLFTATHKKPSLSDPRSLVFVHLLREPGYRLLVNG